VGSLLVLSITTDASVGDPSPRGEVRRSGAGRSSRRRHNSSGATSSGPRGYRPSGPDRHWRSRRRSVQLAGCRSASPPELVLTQAQLLLLQPGQEPQTSVSSNSPSLVPREPSGDQLVAICSGPCEEFNLPERWFTSVAMGDAEFRGGDTERQSSADWATIVFCR
jgi:hypothetical protein